MHLNDSNHLGGTTIMADHSPLRPSCDLTEAAIKAAKPGDILRDANIKGLHLKVGRTGAKAFLLYYRTKAGVERRPKLGDYGIITLTQARDAAKSMLAKVALGGDPSADIQVSKNEHTVAELWYRYWDCHGRFKKSAKGDQTLWNSQLAKRFGKMRVTHVRFEDVATMMAKMEDTPIQANRCQALLSKMFNMALHQFRWVERNPCKGVARYKERTRERYMTPDEAKAISLALAAKEATDPASVAFIYLLIYTGCRKSEIAKARWDQVDGNILRLPDTKTGARTVFLNPEVLAILERLPRTSGTLTGILSPYKLWKGIRKAAGCPDLRLHDLRHSFASVALASGLSLSEIGMLLGHTSTQTTKRYAHLVKEHGVAASAAVSAKLSAMFMPQR